MSARVQSIKVHTDVSSFLSDLRTKSGVLTRCIKEYGTYLDELENDKKRLKELQDAGKEIKQQTQIVEETTHMIPLTKQNATRTCDNFIEFWNANKPIVERKVQEAAGTDEVAKWKKELETYHERVSATMKQLDSKPNQCPLNEAKRNDLQSVLNEMEIISSRDSKCAKAP